MIKIVQITDSHLGSNSGDELLSMDVDESLQDVLSLVKSQHATIDLVLATGDIANDPSISAYQRFYSTVSETLASPIAWIPGNHDKPALMSQIIDAEGCRLLEMGKWVIILMDSQVSGEVYGNLNAASLAHLETLLKENTDKHVLISFHHQPVPIGSHWMDQYILKNADEFWAVIKPFNNIRSVIWGHVHQQFEDERKGIRLMASPSTCIQFKPNEDDFALHNVMPGYRWLELHDDGSIITDVERVSKKDYGVDFGSDGY